MMNISVHFIRGTTKTTSTALLSEESSYQKLKGIKHYAVAYDHSLLTNDNIIISSSSSGGGGGGGGGSSSSSSSSSSSIIIRHLFGNLMLGSKLLSDIHES